MRRVGRYYRVRKRHGRWELLCPNGHLLGPVIATAKDYGTIIRVACAWAKRGRTI